MGLSKRWLLFLTILPFSAFSQAFKIQGKVTGIKDNTWLYLRGDNPTRNIDSARVINGEFLLSGKINGKAEELVLHTAKFSDYVFFWVENKPMTVVLKANEFRKAVIKGSAVQDDKNNLLRSTMPIIEKEDSLIKLRRVSKDTVEQNLLSQQIIALKKDEEEADKIFITKHPGSLVSANLLSDNSTTWGKKIIMSLYKNLSPEMKKTEYGVNVKNFIELNKDVDIGEKFTDFEELNTQGKKIKLSTISAKYVLLEFWASWCGPCRSENPSLVKIYAKFKDRGFAVLGVSLDDNKTEWLNAIETDKLTWENVSDLNGNKNKAVLIYGIHSIPDNFLIDSNGTIIARNLRGEELEKKLQALLDFK